MTGAADGPDPRTPADPQRGSPEGAGMKRAAGKAWRFAVAVAEALRPLGGGRGEKPLLAAGSIAGRALVIVVAIMTFLASMTAGTVAPWSSSPRPRPAGGRTSRARPRSRSARARDAMSSRKRPARPSSPAPRRASARCGSTGSANRRSCWSRGSAWRWASEIGELPSLRASIELRLDGRPDFALLRRQLAEQVQGALAGRSQAVGAAARRDGERHGRRRARHHAAGAGRDGAGHRLRHARRHGRQPEHHRGSRSRRRDGRLHRARVPEAFPAARPEGGRPGRRRRHARLLAGWRHRPPASPTRQGAIRSRRCLEPLL